MREWRAFGWMLLGSGWLIIALFVVQYFTSPPSGKEAFANGLLKLWDPSACGDYPRYDLEPWQFAEPVNLPKGSSAAEIADKEAAAEREGGFSAPDSPEGLRFLYLRSFHTPVEVRIAREGSEAWTLVSKRADNHFGPDFPSRLTTERTTTLTDAEMQKWWVTLAKTPFWDPLTKDDPANLDGARWILEARHDGRYRRLDKYSPQDGSFRDFCVRLLHAGNVGQGDLY